MSTLFRVLSFISIFLSEFLVLRLTNIIDAQQRDAYISSNRCIDKYGRMDFVMKIDDIYLEVEKLITNYLKNE